MIAFAALKGFSFALGGLKIIAIFVGFIVVMGFGYAGCQQQFNSGYTSAEADRLEDLSQQNAASAVKLRQDHASSRAAEQRYRQERDDARAAERIAKEARHIGLTEEGLVCTPNCTYSP